MSWSSCSRLPFPRRRPWKQQWNSTASVRTLMDQEPEDATVGALADVLRQSTVWYFWWD